MEAILISLSVWLGIAMVVTLVAALTAVDETGYQLNISRRLVFWGWCWPVLIFVRLAKGLKVLAAGRN